MCGVFLFVCILLGDVERWHAACVGSSMSANHTKRKSNGAKTFLAAARRGNHEAFVALISPHASNLRRLARSFTRNAEDAEDVCQQRLEECDHLQKPDADSWGENPEASYARRERSRIIMEAVAALPTGLRRVCMLRNLEELSTKEVADRLGLPAVTVRVRLFRAHCELRKRLGGAGSQDGEQVRRPPRYAKQATAESRQQKNPNILMNSANRMNSRAKTATLSLKCPILERQIPIPRKAEI